MDSFFDQANALLDRIFDIGLMAFIGLLVVLSLWLIITLLGRGERH